MYLYYFSSHRTSVRMGLLYILPQCSVSIIDWTIDESVVHFDDVFDIYQLFHSITQQINVSPMEWFEGWFTSGWYDNLGN